MAGRIPELLAWCRRCRRDTYLHKQLANRGERFGRATSGQRGIHKHRLTFGMRFADMR